MAQNTVHRAGRMSEYLYRNMKMRTTHEVIICINEKVGKRRRPVELNNILPLSMGKGRALWR